MLASLLFLATATSHQQDPRDYELKIDGLSLIVRTDKQSYKIGEDIVLNVEVRNTSDVYIAMDSSFRRTWNMTVEVKDGAGKSVDWPGSDIVLRVMQPRSNEGFVTVKPNCYYGALRAYTFQMMNNGKYSVHVMLYGGANEETIERLKIQGYVWGYLKAKPVEIEITE